MKRPRRRVLEKGREKMPGYIVYWPQDHVKDLEKAGDAGPIRVVFGSIHARMPSIASVKEGDIVYPEIGRAHV